MQIHRSTGARNGNTLLITLWTLFLVAMVVAVYLRLSVNNNQLAARSQVWNACLPVVEAGIEEALTHCIANSTNMISNGWRQDVDRCARTNAIGDGYYEVNISTNEPFDILSTGYYPMPGSSAFVSRKVRVITEPQPVFGAGIIARNSIRLNGAVRIDSFNSRDPARSADGLYDPAKAGDRGDIACLNPGGPFDVGNADIWGHVLASPGAVIQIGGSGSVGSSAWHLIERKGVETKWSRTDLNLTLPPLPAQNSAALPPLANKLVSGILYNNVLDGGDFQLPVLLGKTVVTARSTIVVFGSIDSSQLVIKSNASVRFFCVGPSAKFSSIVNENRTATSVSLFGSPTLVTLELGDNWSGAVYAPNADLVVAGGTQISGGVIVNNFSMQGNSQFHYDEALASTNNRAFIVTSWKEL